MNETEASGVRKVKDLQIDHFRRMRKDFRRFRSERVLNLDAQSRRHLLDLLSLRPNKVVLELGCGEANIKNMLPSGVQYVGIDVYLPILKVCKAEVINSPMELLPIRKESVDYILCRQVMEHTFDRHMVLREAGRVLKFTGKIVSETPHYFPDSEPAHITQRTIFQWQLDFIRNGFHILRAELGETTALMAIVLAEKHPQPHYLFHMLLFSALSLFRQRRIIIPIQQFLLRIQKEKPNYAPRDSASTPSSK